MLLMEMGQPQHSALKHVTLNTAVSATYKISSFFFIDSSHIFYWYCDPHLMGLESHSVRKQ